MQSHQNDQPGLQAQLASTESYLVQDPHNPSLLARMIDLCLDAGEPARALRHAEAAVARYPDDKFLAYRHGVALMSLLRWADALAVLAPLAATDHDVNLATSVATCQMMLGRPAEVLVTLAPYGADPAAAVAADAQPLPAAAVTLLVRAYHHLGAVDVALAVIAAQRARLSGDAAFAGAAALASLDAGLLDDARAFSAAAAAASAGGATLESQVVDATIALADTDSDAAIAGFEAVLARRPDEGRSWSGLGMSNLLKRDFGKAGPQLEQAALLMPAHIGTWHALGWCRIFQHDLAAADQAFARALELDRNFGETHGAMAVVAAMRGQRDAAQAAAARAIGLDKNSLAARYAQMILAGDTLDPERFRALAMRLLRQHQTLSGESLADVVRRNAL